MKVTKEMAVMGFAVAIAGVLGAATAVFARGTGGPTHAGGRCEGGMGMGPGGGHRQDMTAIHALFANRDRIHRTVKEIPGGVQTTTESDDPGVAAQVREHVRSMYTRLEEKRPIHARDPLFAALFASADEIAFRMEDTAKGVTVTETSDNPKVVALIRRHAEVVTKFIANGMPEMMRTH